MKAYLKALSLWETTESEHDPFPPGSNPTVAQIKIYEDVKSRKLKALTYSKVVEKMMIILPVRFESKISAIKESCDLKTICGRIDLSGTLEEDEESDGESSLDLPVLKTRSLFEIYKSPYVAISEQIAIKKQKYMKFGLKLWRRRLRSENEATLYMKKAKGGVVILVTLYIDDLLEIGSNEAMVQDGEVQACTDPNMLKIKKISKFEGGHRADPRVYRSLIDMFSWNSKKQDVIAQSSVEEEYIADAGATNQALWLIKILLDLEQYDIEATFIKVDNKSTISMAENPVQHGRIKHTNVKFHTIRKAEKDVKVKLVHCNSDQQIEDIMTKALPNWKFEVLRAKLGVSKNNVKEEC
nr:uncharacterized protein LOC109119710 [Solanum lycopersicum]